MSCSVSAASNEAVLVVGAGLCSGSPVAPRALAASVTGGTVVLAWSAPPGATSYVVEAGSSAGAANFVNTDLGSPATTLTATGVGPGRYFVRIRGKNACGVGPASNEIVVNVR